MADNTKPGQQVHKPHDLTRVQFIGAEDVQEYGELVLLTGELIGKGGQQDIPQGIFQGVHCVGFHGHYLLSNNRTGVLIKTIPKCLS